MVKEEGPRGTDSSPLGSPIPGILQARTLERVAIAFSTALLSSRDAGLLEPPERPQGSQGPHC